MASKRTTGRILEKKPKKIRKGLQKEDVLEDFPEEETSEEIPIGTREGLVKVYFRGMSEVASGIFPNYPLNLDLQKMI